MSAPLDTRPTSGADARPALGTLDAWLARLESQHPVAIDLGLERVAAVAARLGLEARSLATTVVTVAGTNGKGSTVAMIERLARAHGLTTAAYTSPHLLRYNERLQFDGDMADDDTWVAAFERVEAARLQDDPISLTYFEAGTLAALLAIAEARPHVAILEVGLGGRLDAVNVVDADIAVITTIAHDHADFLGDDLEGIGREKAGILRPGRPVVLGSRELPRSVSARIDELATPADWLGVAFDRGVAADGTWWWRGDANAKAETGRESRGDAGARIEALPDPGLPLDNAAVALQVVSLCGVSLDASVARDALAAVSLPGRMQWIGNWCLDVAHNPHAATYVAQRLATRPRPARRIGVLGVLGDKDAVALYRALSPVVDAWIAVGLAGPRGRDGRALAALLEAHGAEVMAVAESPGEGVQWLASRLEATQEALVCGSFFTVAQALEALAPVVENERQ